MADKPEVEYAKHLVWNRDALGRLYYPFWILFMTGFVISLRVPRSAQSCIVLCGLVVFRLLAVLGTSINFLMQYHAIDSLSHASIYLFKKAKGEAPEALYDEDRKAKKSDDIAMRFETPLQAIAALFLLVALVLSFLVYTPA